MRQEEGAAADDVRQRQRHEECGEQAEHPRHRETGMAAEWRAGDLVLASRLEDLRREQRHQQRPQRARHEGDRDGDGERREQQEPAAAQGVDELIGPRRERSEALGRRLPKRADHGRRPHVHGPESPHEILSREPDAAGRRAVMRPDLSARHSASTSRLLFGSWLRLVLLRLQVLLVVLLRVIALAHVAVPPGSCLKSADCEPSCQFNRHIRGLRSLRRDDFVLRRAWLGRRSAP